jgi:peptide chain release factor subunit 1
VAGSAEFKQDLTKNTDLFDPRLSAVLIPPLLDVSYGGEPGFNQAIELASETLKNVKFIKEKKLMSKFFDEVSQDTGKYCFGIKDTIQGLEMGAVETLVIWEELEYKRVIINNPHTDKKETHYLTPKEEKNEKLYRCPDTGVELEVQESEIFVEWIVANYKSFGTKLEFVTDRSQEGNQFVKGFGGIGGLMRYRVEFELFDEPEVKSDSDDDFM